MRWTPQQEAIFAAIEDYDGPHLLVTARAGTGKTTTTVEAARRVPAPDRPLIVAFNKRIQETLEERLEGRTPAKTVHALGYSALMRKIGRLEVRPDRTRTLAHELMPHSMKINADRATRNRAARDCARLVSLCKNLLIQDLGRAQDIAMSYGVTDDPAVPPWALAVMKRELATVTLDRELTFDDMIWLPSQLGILPRTADVLFVDEAQDLNPAQMWLIRKMLRNDGRLVAVGDPAQGIYKWRGAGTGIMQTISADFEAQSLPLTLSFRCAKAIAEVARRGVPDFHALPNAPEGTVEQVAQDHLIGTVAPEDFVLSRTNAALIPVCLALLRDGKPAHIIGRDLAGTLIALIRKSGRRTTEDLRKWLQDHVKEARDRDLSDEALSAIQDRVACLITLSDGLASTEDVTARIQKLYSDEQGTSGIYLSTVHKAKGLEAPRVWMLTPTFRQNTQEEKNVWYVAVTRAKRHLFLVQ